MGNLDMEEAVYSLQPFVGHLAKENGAAALQKKGENNREILGFLYYKRKDFFTAKERLKECVSLELESSANSRARGLLDYIWNYKIKPAWWR